MDLDPEAAPVVWKRGQEHRDGGSATLKTCAHRWAGQTLPCEEANIFSSFTGGGAWLGIPPRASHRLGQVCHGATPSPLNIFSAWVPHLEPHLEHGSCQGPSCPQGQVHDATGSSTGHWGKERGSPSPGLSPEVSLRSRVSTCLQSAAPQVLCTHSWVYAPGSQQPESPPGVGGTHT